MQVRRFVYLILMTLIWTALLLVIPAARPQTISSGAVTGAVAGPSGVVVAKANVQLRNAVTLSNIFPILGQL